MQCMKCGREIPAGQVFCEECLAEMEAYPVKPGTVVTLPPRTVQPSTRKSMFHRSPSSLEERVKRQGKTIRVLSWLLTLTTALGIAAGALVISLLHEETDTVLPGQNYSAEGETKDPPEWNIDRSEFPGTEDNTTEDTSATYPGINGFSGN